MTASLFFPPGHFHAPVADPGDLPPFEAATGSGASPWPRRR